MSFDFTMFSFKRRPQTTKNLDQQLVFQLSKSRIPSPRQLKYLSHFIKGRERLFLYGFFVIMVSGLAILGSLLYQKYIELIPKAGGTYIEAMLGNPQYVNPLYASLNPIDADLEELLFSRLYTSDAEGNTVPDLADEQTISAENKTYKITLREAHWPTGELITADDVLFTFNLIQNPDYKSPLNARFSQVTAEKVDDKTISFSLSEPYGRFTSLLDFGILPKNLWEGVSPEMIPLAELNLKPIGSGPYKLKSLVKNNTGTIRSYTLERNEHYYGQAPYLDKIIFKFFPSSEEMVAAINNGHVNGLAELPANLIETIIAKNSLNFHTIPQPYLTAVFFNAKAKGAVSLAPIRQALTAIEKQNVLSIAGQSDRRIADSLIPASYTKTEAMPALQLNEAQQLLEKNDWKLRTLTTADLEAIKTSKTPGSITELGVGEWRMKGNDGIIITLAAPTSLKGVAEKVAEDWKKLGVKVNLKIQEDTQIQNQALANKDFDAIIYTEALETGDPFPFWATDGPGNISGYSRSDVDTWLKEARLSSDANVVSDRYNKFQTALITDVPAIPLFWQAYIYPQTKKLKGFSSTFLSNSSDRFIDIESWYLKVKRQIK